MGPDPLLDPAPNQGAFLSYAASMRDRPKLQAAPPRTGGHLSLRLRQLPFAMSLARGGRLFIT